MGVGDRGFVIWIWAYGEFVHLRLIKGRRDFFHGRLSPISQEKTHMQEKNWRCRCPLSLLLHFRFEEVSSGSHGESQFRWRWSVLLSFLKQTNVWSLVWATVAMRKSMAFQPYASTRGPSESKPCIHDIHINDNLVSVDTTERVNTWAIIVFLSCVRSFSSLGIHAGTKKGDGRRFQTENRSMRIWQDRKRFCFVEEAVRT